VEDARSGGVRATGASRGSSGGLGRRQGIRVPVLGRNDVQIAPIEQILGAWGGGPGDTGRGTFKVGERKCLSVTPNAPAQAPAGPRTLVRALPWIAVAWAISWLALLDAHALFNPDEGRYAEIPREMLASGHWLVPRLNGFVYVEKPPLQYWATAVSLAVFGNNDWAARLYAGLCGLVTVWAAWLLARRLWGSAAGWRAGIFTASSLLVVLLAHQLTLDMSLTCYITVMLAGFMLAQHHRDEPSRCRRWMWLAWASAALAVLTKGIVAVVLPGATLVIYSLWQRDGTAWRRLSIGVGLPGFLLIAAPWFVLMQREVPQFFDFFFIREHFARFLTRIEDRYEPWWFFIPVLIAGLLPWVVPAARSLASGWRAQEARGKFDARRFLWTWCVVTFCFFSASDSKLVPYILPIFPALAVLMAAATEARLQKELRLTAFGVTAAGLLLIATAVFAPHLTNKPPAASLLLLLRPSILVMGVLALAGGLAAIRMRSDSLAPVATIGLVSYVCFGILIWGAKAITPLYSGVDLARHIPSSTEEEVPVFSVRTYDQTLPFYLERTVTLVQERNEMDFGVRLEPRKAIDSLEDFESRWRASKQAYAVMKPDTYSELQMHGLPMILQARNPHRLLVSRR
jgi:4-amino-4-deoxy-L-arabinose transferase-like glycosyltransferase